jgi:serine/threonine protein kinase
MSRIQGPSQPPPPYLLDGRYLAVDHIARGDMSNVYSGSDTWTGEHVAIRFLRADRPERERTFRGMAERLFGLTSARVVRAIHTSDDRKGRPYLVTELLIGRGIQTLGKVRWEVACELTRHGALALRDLHLQGLSHGTLSARSFFVAASAETGSRVKLLDLGVGGRGASPRRDLVALAGILHGLLFGAPPHHLGIIPRIPNAPAELSEALEGWLMAEERNTEVSVVEMAKMLRAFIDPTGEDTGPRPPMVSTGEIVLPKLSRIVFGSKEPTGEDDE